MGIAISSTQGLDLDWVDLCIQKGGDLVEIQKLLKLYRKTPQDIKEAASQGFEILKSRSLVEYSPLNDLAAIYVPQQVSRRKFSSDLVALADSSFAPSQLFKLQERVRKMRDACLLCVLAQAAPVVERISEDDDKPPLLWVVAVPKAGSASAQTLQDSAANRSMQMLLSMSVSLSVCALKGLQGPARLESMNLAFGSMTTLLSTLLVSNNNNNNSGSSGFTSRDVPLVEVADTFSNIYNQESQDSPIAAALDMVMSLIDSVALDNNNNNSSNSSSNSSTGENAAIVDNAVSLLFVMSLCTRSLRLFLRVLAWLLQLQLGPQQQGVVAIPAVTLNNTASTLWGIFSGMNINPLGVVGVVSSSKDANAITSQALQLLKAEVSNDGNSLLFSVRCGPDADQCVDVIDILISKLRSTDSEVERYVGDLCLALLRMVRINVAKVAESVPLPLRHTALKQESSQRLLRCLESFLGTVGQGQGTNDMNNVIVEEIIAVFVSLRHVLLPDAAAQFQFISRLLQGVIAQHHSLDPSGGSAVTVSGRGQLLQAFVSVLSRENLMEMLAFGSAADLLEVLMDQQEGALEAVSDGVVSASTLTSDPIHALCSRLLVQLVVLSLTVLSSKVQNLLNVSTSGGEDESMSPGGVGGVSPAPITPRTPGPSSAHSKAGTGAGGAGGGGVSLETIESVSKSVEECGLLVLKLVGAAKKHVNALLRGQGRSRSNNSSSSSSSSSASPLATFVRESSIARVTPVAVLALNSLLRRLHSHTAAGAQVAAPKTGNNKGRAGTPGPPGGASSGGSSAAGTAVPSLSAPACLRLSAAMESVGSFFDSALQLLGSPVAMTPQYLLREPSTGREDEGGGVGTDVDDAMEDAVKRELHVLSSAMDNHDTAAAAAAGAGAGDESLGMPSSNNGVDWIQCLAAEVWTLRVHVCHLLVAASSATAFIDLAATASTATATATDGTGAAASAKEWIQGPLLGSGLIGEGSAVTGSVADLLVSGVDADPRRQRLITSMRTAVPADRRNAPAEVNRCVHSACACLIYHCASSFMSEAAALSDGTGSGTRPSPPLVGVWRIAQDMRPTLEGAGPSVTEAIMGRIHLLLRVEPLYLRETSGATANSNAALVMRFILQGPPAGALTKVLDLQEACASSRCKGFGAAQGMLSEASTDDAKLGVLRALSRGLLVPGTGNEQQHAHGAFLADLRGCNLRSMTRVLEAWYSLAMSIITECATHWLPHSSEPTPAGTICANAVIFALAVVCREYVPQEMGPGANALLSSLLQLLASAVDSSLASIRLCVLSATEVLLHSLSSSPAVVGDKSKPQTPQLVQFAQSVPKYVTAAELKSVLEGLMGVLQQQLQRCSGHQGQLQQGPGTEGGFLLRRPAAGAESELSACAMNWLVPSLAICDPSEPGAVCPYAPVSAVHVVSLWIRRAVTSHSSDGIILTKAGAMSSADDAAARAWASVCIALQEDRVCVQLGRGGGGVSATATQALAINQWTHVSYRISARDSTLALFINGVRDCSVALPSSLLGDSPASTPPRSNINTHPWVVGQAPSYADSRRAAHCAVAHVCVLNGEVSEAGMRAVPQWAILSRATLSVELKDRATAQIRRDTGTTTNGHDVRGNAFARLPSDECSYCVRLNPDGAGASNIDLPQVSVGLATISSVEESPLGFEGQYFVFGLGGHSIGVHTDSRRVSVLRQSQSRRWVDLSRPLRFGDQISVDVSLSRGLVEVTVTGSDGSRVASGRFPIPSAAHQQDASSSTATKTASVVSKDSYVFGVSMGLGTQVVIEPLATEPPLFAAPAPAHPLAAPAASKSASNVTTVKVWDMGLTLLSFPMAALLGNNSNCGNMEALSTLSAVSRVTQTTSKDAIASQVLQYTLLPATTGLALSAASSSVRLAATSALAQLLPSSQPSVVNKLSFTTAAFVPSSIAGSGSNNSNNNASLGKVGKSFLHAALHRLGCLVNPLTPSHPSGGAGAVTSPISFVEVSQLFSLVNAIVQHTSVSAEWNAELRSVIGGVLADANAVVDRVERVSNSGAQSDGSLFSDVSLNSLLGLLCLLGSQSEALALPGTAVFFRDTPQGLPEPAVVLSFAPTGVFGDSLEICSTAADQTDHDAITTIPSSSLCPPASRVLTQTIRDILNDRNYFVVCAHRILNIPVSVRDLSPPTIAPSSSGKNDGGALAALGTTPSVLLLGVLRAQCLSALQTYVSSISVKGAGGDAALGDSEDADNAQYAQMHALSSAEAAYSVLIDVWPLLLTEFARTALDVNVGLSAVPATLDGTALLLAKAVADSKACFAPGIASSGGGGLVMSSSSRISVSISQLIQMLSQLPLAVGSGSDSSAAGGDVVSLSKKFIESLSTAAVPSMYSIAEPVTATGDSSSSSSSSTAAAGAGAGAGAGGASAATETQLVAKTFNATDVHACPMLVAASPACAYLESLQLQSLSLLYHLLVRILSNWPKRLSLCNNDDRLNPTELGTLMLLFKVSGMEDSNASGAPRSTPLLEALVQGPSSLGDDTVSGASSSSVSAFGNCLVDMCNGLLKRIFSSGEAQIAEYLNPPTTNPQSDALSAYTRPSLLLALRLFDLVLGFNSPQYRDRGSALFLQAQHAKSILRSIVQALSYFHLLPAKFSKYLLALIGRSLWQMRLQYLRDAAGTGGSFSIPVELKSLLRSIASRVILIARDACTEYSKVPSKGYISDVYQGLLQTAIMSADLFGLELFEKEDESGAKVNTDPAFAPRIIESVHPLPVAGGDTYTKVAPQELLNKAGVATAPGQGSTSHVLYCGRRLGRDAIPGSDGRCGPTNGPQCNDCKGMTVANYPVMGWTVAFDPATTLTANHDFVTFYKDSSHTDYWGEARYSATRLPGVNGNPPLQIDGHSFEVYCHAAAATVRNGAASAGASAAGAAGGGGRRLAVGDRVRLVNPSVDDAAAGPLSGSDVGVIFEDDESDKPFNVRAAADGRTWWYCAAALGRADAEPAAAAGASGPAPTGRLRVGERVILSDTYATQGDAKSGPLAPGNIGVLVKDDNSSKPFQVRVESGPKVGKTWWYVEGALVRAPADSAASTAAPPTGRLAVGERVILTSGYASMGDASSGPLKPGDVGVVLKDDNSSKPFQIRADTGAKAGSTWWYVEGALQRAVETAAPTPAPAAASTSSAAPAVAVTAAPPARLAVGDHCMLSDTFATVGDAAGGPLAVGDVGTVVTDDASTKPFRVRSLTGASIGSMWWYEPAALVRVDPSVVNSVINTGDRVILTNEQHSLTGDGLKFGDTGVVTEITVSAGKKMVTVRVEGGPRNGATRQYEGHVLTKLTGPSQIIGATPTAPVVAAGAPAATASTSTAAAAPVAAAPAAAVPAAPVRPVVGDRVVLTPTYESAGDAKGGPLKPGDVGVLLKDDGSSKPFQVRAESGAKVGSTWWYLDGAIMREASAAPAAGGTAAAPAPAPAAAAPAPTGRLTVGERVMLAPGFESMGDASGGPLKAGDIGVLMKDDNSSKPFQVKVETGAKVGSTWWYLQNALVRAGAAPSPATGATPAATPAAAAPAPAARTGRITAGERVILSSTYESMGDAKGGPLKPGDVGILLKDDSSSKPFQVKAETGAKAGSTWWYQEGAIVREPSTTPSTAAAPAPAAAPVPTGRLTVGERVCLVADYTSMGDSSGGPLRPGDIGVLLKDDNSSKPFQVKAETGAKAGSTWWYIEGALTRPAPTTAAPEGAAPAPAAAATVPTGRLTVGERVILADGYASMGDASGGPLKVGDVGIVLQDDRSGKPFQVKAETGAKAGTAWWYLDGAITRAAAAPTPAGTATAAAPAPAAAASSSSSASAGVGAPSRAPVMGDIVERNGPVWTWGDQDGGVGSQGKVTGLPANGWIEVQWTNGNRNRYRWGSDGCYDVVLKAGAAGAGTEAAGGATATPWGFRLAATPLDASNAPETRIIESPHPYLDNQNIFQVVDTLGATSYRITFDSQSCFENGCDYVRFYKDSSHTSYWGENKYTGGRNGSAKILAGVGSTPALIIPASSFVFHFHSDGSVNDWGYKISVTAVGAQSSKRAALRRLEVLQQLFASLSRLHSPDGGRSADEFKSGLVHRIDCALVRFIDAYARETNASSTQLKQMRWPAIVSDERAAPLLVQFPLLTFAMSDPGAQAALAEANAKLRQEGAFALALEDRDEEVTVNLVNSGSGASAMSAAQSILDSLPSSERGVVEMLAEAMNVTATTACEAFLASEKNPDTALTLLMSQLESGVALSKEVEMERDAKREKEAKEKAAKEAAEAKEKADSSKGAGPEISNRRVVRSISHARASAAADSTSSSSSSSSGPVAVDPLEARFDFINQVNADFIECQSVINLSQDEEAFAIGSLLGRHREYIYQRSKADIFTQSLQSSQVAGQAFELTLSRSRALRFGSHGETDVEGRWSIFGQVFRAVQGMDPAVLRRADQLWKVVLAGERAQDAGGPYRESFTLMCAELMSTTLPLLIPCANARNAVGNNRDAYVVNPDSVTTIQEQMLEFLGKLLGCAARSSHYLDLTIAPIVWKLIAGEAVTLEDLRDVDSLTVSTTESIRTFQGSAAEFDAAYGDLNFNCLSAGGANTIELVPRGNRRVLSHATRQEYCDALISYRMREFAPACAIVRRGLATQLPQALLGLVCGHELERMVCGQPDVDVALLRSVCEYSSYNESDEIVRWFWEILTEFTVDDRKAFLRFIWGRSRLPLNRAAFTQRMKITRLDKPRPDTYLPVAHTCFFSIDIPRYSTKEIMKERLHYSIYNCTAIDGDDTTTSRRAAALGMEDEF